MIESHDTVGAATMNAPSAPCVVPDPRFGAATDVGRLRSVNEDGYLATAPAFIVVDGMGGHAAGRSATRAALGALGSLTSTRVTDVDTVVDTVRAAAAAVTAIPSHALYRPGATVAGVVLADLAEGPTWIAFNIGDARVYLLREGLLEQVTKDHSHVQALIDAHRLTPLEARTDPRRNVVTRALGGGINDAGVPDTHLLPVRGGDRILVCSDGLSDELDDEALATVLGAGLSPQRAAEMCVAAALEAGGHDNATALVVDMPAREGT